MIVSARRTVARAATALALVVATGGGVAATAVGDPTATSPARPAVDARTEQRIDALLAKMTLPEKLQQLQLLSDGQITEADAKAGVGSVFSLVDPVKINQIQHVAVEQSRLHIPILFAYDTIHGFRTVFPVPLGAASSFDPAVAKADATYGARESAAVGIKQVYSPMLDVSRDPRWGRIVEGAGEDPYLNAAMGVARVQGAQGTDYSQPDKVASSIKHFVAYGQPEGGRDYNTTDMSIARLRNVYLPPFKAAVEAGAATVMCSFNAINGSPGCGDDQTETQILKKEWGFDGFVESDYTAVDEMRACPPVQPDTGPCGHGVVADGPGAAARALNSGTDSEMVSTNIRDYGARLVANGRVPIARVDDAVRRILRVKFRAGLFEHPYVDVSSAESAQLLPDAVAAARTAGSRSMVLLKNDKGLLPLDPARKTAVIGPLADDQHEMLGPWWGQGQDADAVSVLTGIKAQSPGATYAQACPIADVDPPAATPQDVCGNTAGFDAAVAVAQAADQVVLVLGEARGMTGEAASRSDISLPGKQQELIDRVRATGKPFVVVLMNGRPLTLPDVAASSPAILEAWFPGVQAGNSVADVLFGKVNPGGKLPVSFPQTVGQVPIYYAHEPTGRPCDVTQKYDSRYRDLTTCDPFYAFGYGLSYTTFDIANLKVSAASIPKTGNVTVTVDVRNTGARAGDEVVQLYLHDPVASLTQPVRRLRGFERVTLAPGTSKKVSFTLGPDDFGFYDNAGHFVVEPGRIDLFAGDSSQATLQSSVTLK